MNLLGCYGGREEENAAWTIKQVSEKATGKKIFLKTSTMSTLPTLNLWQ
jgi:hypothetical protein